MDEAIVKAGRQAMAVNIPPRPEVPEKLTLFPFRPALPQPLVIGPEAIDNAAPIAAFLFHVGD